MDGFESNRNKSTQSEILASNLRENEQLFQPDWTTRYSNNRIREQCRRVEDTFVSAIRDLTEKDYREIKQAVANNEHLEPKDQEFINIHASMRSSDLAADIKNFNAINKEVGLACLGNVSPEVQARANSLIDEINSSAKDFEKLAAKGGSGKQFASRLLEEAIQGDNAAQHLQKILEGKPEVEPGKQPSEADKTAALEKHTKHYQEQLELFSTHEELAKKARKVLVGSRIICESLDSSPLTWGSVNSKAIAFCIEALGGESERDLSTDGYPGGIKIGARQIINPEKVARRMQMLSGYIDDLMKSYGPEHLRALENNPKLDPLLSMAMQQLRLRIAQDLPQIQKLKDYTACGAQASHKKMEKFSWEFYGLDGATETMSWYADSLKRKIKEGPSAPDINDRYCNDAYLLKE